MANQWYVVHTYSGHEDKVKNSIERTVENLGMKNLISQILVPTEEVVSVKNNKRKIRKRNSIPVMFLLK